LLILLFDNTKRGNQRNQRDHSSKINGQKETPQVFTMRGHINKSINYNV